MIPTRSLILRALPRFYGGLVLIGVVLFSPAIGFSAKPGFRIINAHEHLESREETAKYLQAANTAGVEKTVLLGSPVVTFHPEKAMSFLGYEKNNAEILEIAKTAPEHFIPFVTIDPLDPQKKEKLLAYVEAGAKGVKLYGGHVEFHQMPLDAAEMIPVYDYCQSHNLPVMFHVNAGYYLKEFEKVLNDFPKMKVICPHFCLSSIAEERFRFLMDYHPNLYTDISFGQVSNVISGFNRISQNPGKFRRLILQYQDRIFFGTDVVISSMPARDSGWISRMIRGYRDMLEKEEFTFVLTGAEKLKGLNLKPQVLRKIYFDNFEALMNAYVTKTTLAES